MPNTNISLIDITQQVCQAVINSGTCVAISVDAIRKHYGRNLNKASLDRLIALIGMQLVGSDYMVKADTTKDSTFLVFTRRQEKKSIMSATRLNTFLQGSMSPVQTEKSVVVEIEAPTLLSMKAQCLLLRMLIPSDTAPIVINAVPSNIITGVEYSYTTKCWHSLTQLQEIVNQVITDIVSTYDTPGYEDVDPTEISRLHYTLDDVANTLTVEAYPFFQAVFYATKEVVTFSAITG